MDITRADFEREVIEASASMPVLVDFWAPWCAPCRALGPVLEKLAAEYHGRVKLVKVNSDDEQEIAAAFGVRSIPAVFAFHKGRAVDRFVGALPEAQVRAFIERVLPSPHEGELEIAGQLISKGELDEAERILAKVPPNIDWDAKLEALRAAIGYGRAASTTDETSLREDLKADPANHEARLALARLHAARRRYREAMEELVEIVRRDKSWRDGLARSELLHLFTLANDAALVGEYRRKLATALY